MLAVASTCGAVAVRGSAFSAGRHRATTPLSSAGRFCGTSLAPAPLGRSACTASPQRARQPLPPLQAAYKPQIPERILGSLPYLLPLFDGLRYGRFFFMQFPGFTKVLQPLLPLAELYFSVPFAPILVFFAVYLGIVNNMEMSRFVRFNAMQAVLLDIILIVPSLVENIFRGGMGGSGIALQIYISVYNSIWLFVFASFAYGVGSCMVGQTARLPLVADAADAQVR